MRLALISSTFCFLAIAGLGLLGQSTGSLVLIAPFAASSFVLFCFPASPFAQFKNLIGGYLISAVIGLLFVSWGSGSVFMIAGAVALVAFFMLVSGSSHPPAAGVPIVIISSQASWSFLLSPILLGVLFLSLLSWLYQQLLKKHIS